MLLLILGFVGSFKIIVKFFDVIIVIREYISEERLWYKLFFVLLFFYILFVIIERFLY